MDTAEALRNIQKNRIVDDGDRFAMPKPPGGLRNWLYIGCAVVVVLSALGITQTPYVYSDMILSQDVLNSRLQAQLPYGNKVKIVEAQIDLSGGLFAYDVVASDGLRMIEIRVGGNLSMSPDGERLKPLSPITTEGELVYLEKTTGQRASEAVPAMSDRIKGETTGWQVFRSAVAVLETGAKLAAGAIGNVSDGEFMSELQFPGQARQAAWDLPAVKFTDDEKAVLNEASIDRISISDNAIMLNLSTFRFTPLAILCLVLIVSSLGMIWRLYSAPEWLLED